eukprot:365291-Chlamydomonas_euryale.AAC.10
MGRMHATRATCMRHGLYADCWVACLSQAGPFACRVVCPLHAGPVACGARLFARRMRGLCLFDAGHGVGSTSVSRAA